MGSRAMQIDNTFTGVSCANRMQVAQSKEGRALALTMGVDAVSPFDACASCTCPRCAASLALSGEEMAGPQKPAPPPARTFLPPPPTSHDRQTNSSSHTLLRTLTSSRTHLHLTRHCSHSPIIQYPFRAAAFSSPPSSRFKMRSTLIVGAGAALFAYAAANDNTGSKSTTHTWARRGQCHDGAAAGAHPQHHGI